MKFIEKYRVKNMEYPKLPRYFVSVTDPVLTDSQGRLLSGRSYQLVRVNTNLNLATIIPIEEGVSEIVNISSIQLQINLNKSVELPGIKKLSYEIITASPVEKRKKWKVLIHTVSAFTESEICDGLMTACKSEGFNLFSCVSINRIKELQMIEPNYKLLELTFEDAQLAQGFINKNF